MSVRSLSPADSFARMGQAPALLLDVRTPGEFSAIHAEGAVNLPLQEVSLHRLRQVSQQKDLPIFVLCQSGARAEKACQTLMQEVAGLEIYRVTGGTAAWASAGLPVVRGKGVISLERQVRILAGFIVVLGVALSVWVSPSFVWLAGFIGAGLMFAGISGWCGMASVLAAMPWNKA